ncbi:P-loop containing nucleoside triphosphate hydrolase protein [Penicillium sp. CMV-2018d]|nr:P-loop containing nucleoside triphosphate hydrolase protein [Penicillium sp. CMV-2018d]
MAIISSVIVNPISILCAIPISLLTLWYAADYWQTTREVKRLESIALSLIFDHFVTDITGLTTIRSFGLFRAMVEADTECELVKDTIRHGRSALRD